MQETGIRSLGGEDLLEKGMAAHSSILAWRIPWSEEPGRLQSIHTAFIDLPGNSDGKATMWETQVQSLGRADPLEKEMATRCSLLAWRIPWTEEPGRL